MTEKINTDLEDLYHYVYSLTILNNISNDSDKYKQMLHICDSIEEQLKTLKKDMISHLANS